MSTIKNIELIRCAINNSNEPSLLKSDALSVVTCLEYQGYVDASGVRDNTFISIKCELDDTIPELTLTNYLTGISRKYTGPEKIA